jgi:hypothetical protein
LDSASDVSICILNRNQRSLLKDCLASCFAELDRSKLAGQVIVVDNASTDGSPEMVSELFPEVNLICNKENVGFSSANNQGIRLSTGRYVLILNNDTVLLPGCLEIMVAFMDSHPRVGVTGPKLLNPNGSVQHGYHRALPTLAEPLLALFWLDRFWPGRLLAERARGIDESLEHPTPMEQIAGCSMMLRRQALESVGLFDESFEYWYEDVELCHRFLKCGWEIYYLPRAQIIHYGGATIGKLEPSMRIPMHISGQLRYFRKHRGFFQYALLKGVTIAGLVFRLVVVGSLGLIPSIRVRHPWSGAVNAYWRLLSRVTSNRRRQ